MSNTTQYMIGAKHMVRIVMLLGLLLCSAHSVAIAQVEGVRVISEALDPASITIGEQATLKVRVVYPATHSATLSLPKDTLVHGVEIVESHLVDSLSVNDKLRELIYEVTITSFDSATYQLNNVQAMVGGELYKDASPLRLVVNTLPVNLDAPDEYFDIKAQWTPKFVWQDYLIYIYILLGALALVATIYFVVKYIKAKRRSTEEGVGSEVLLDPYTEAITALEQLKSKGLWEQNQVKLYYTELTDIVRWYIWRVYGINTLERTSGEILEAFRAEVGRDKMYAELRTLLQTADLAKFAKYQPSADENVSLLIASLAFVELNKPEEVTEEEKGGVTEL